MHGIKQSATAPDPYEPSLISQAIRFGELVFVSGQAAIELDGTVLTGGDFDAQADLAFRNLQRVLEAAGSRLDRVLKVTIFVTDMRNFAKVPDLRAKWFTPPYPADSIVEVRSLALPELEIEIEA